MVRDGIRLGTGARLGLLVLCLAFTSAAAGCASEGLVLTREPIAIRLTAADSVGPLAEELAAAYEEAYPWVSVDVAVFNSARAEATLRDGGSDIALLSWLDEGAGAPPLWSTPWTRDGIAVILHPSTPLPGSSLGHLQEIFRGRLQEWDGVVFAVASREAGSGTRSAFEAMVMDYHSVTLNAAVAPSSSAVIEWVASTPGALGYVSSLSIGMRDLGAVRMLAVDDIALESTSLADGSYVLWRQLYLATLNEPTGDVRAFAQWLLGPEGQTVTQLYAAGLIGADAAGRRTPR